MKTPKPSTHHDVPKGLTTLLASTSTPTCVMAGTKDLQHVQDLLCASADWSERARSLGISSEHLQARIVEVPIGGPLGLLGPLRTIMRQNPDERALLQVWLTCLARLLGDQGPVEGIEVRIPQFAASSERVVFVLGDLDALCAQFAVDPVQQRTLRALLTDCLDWLRQIPGRPLGLVVVAHRDLITAVIPQNSAQYLARYSEYALD